LTAGAGVVGVVVAATLAAIFLRGGGSGSGAGSGTGPSIGTGNMTETTALVPQTQAIVASYTPERPMKVTVQESNYIVGGHAMSLEQLGELLAKVPEGSGPGVTIERAPSSRAKAEQDLKEALDKRKMTYASD
jgi:hypothetical protein